LFLNCATCFCAESKRAAVSARFRMGQVLRARLAVRFVFRFEAREQIGNGQFPHGRCFEGLAGDLACVQLLDSGAQKLFCGLAVWGVLSVFAFRGFALLIAVDAVSNPKPRAARKNPSVAVCHVTWLLSGRLRARAVPVLVRSNHGLWRDAARVSIGLREAAGLRAPGARAPGALSFSCLSVSLRLD